MKPTMKIVQGIQGDNGNCLSFFIGIRASLCDLNH